MWLYNVTLNPNLGGGGGVGGGVISNLPQSPDSGWNSISDSRFLIIPLQTKIVITPELVMILTWNLDQ